MLGRTIIEPLQAKDAIKDKMYPSFATSLHSGRCHDSLIILESIVPISVLPFDFKRIFEFKNMMILRHRYKRQQPKSQKASIPFNVLSKWVGYTGWSRERYNLVRPQRGPKLSWMRLQGDLNKGDNLEDDTISRSKSNLSKEMLAKLGPSKTWRPTLVVDESLNTAIGRIHHFRFLKHTLYFLPEERLMMFKPKTDDSK